MGCGEFASGQPPCRVGAEQKRQAGGLTDLDMPILPARVRSWPGPAGPHLLDSQALWARADLAAVVISDQRPATKDGYAASVIWGDGSDAAAYFPFLRSSCPVPTGDYPRKTLMPLCLDIYIVHGGAIVCGVVQADVADLKAQGAHDVRCLRYWAGEAEGKIFCRGSRTGCRRRFRSAGSVVIRRRRVANLIGPAVAGRHDDTVAALLSPIPSEPPAMARRPDHEITRGGWRRARAPWALRASALELVLIKSGWNATHPSPRQGVQGQAPRLDNGGAVGTVCAFDLVERRS